MVEETGGGAMTVKQFCRSHSISIAFYYQLKQEGLQPREMHVKRKVLVSYEAAEKWRRQRELPTAPASAPGEAPADSPLEPAN